MLVLTSIYFVAALKKRGKTWESFCAPMFHKIFLLSVFKHHTLYFNLCDLQGYLVLPMFQILVTCRERSKRVWEKMRTKHGSTKWFTCFSHVFFWTDVQLSLLITPATGNVAQSCPVSFNSHILWTPIWKKIIILRAKCLNMLQNISPMHVFMIFDIMNKSWHPRQQSLVCPFFHEPFEIVRW